GSTGRSVRGLPVSEYAMASIRALCSVARVRALAQLPPVVLGHLDVVVLGGGADVRERLVAFLVRDALHLVEPCHRVTHVRRVGQRFLALAGERVRAVRQFLAVLGRQVAVPFGGLPRCLHTAVVPAVWAPTRAICVARLAGPAYCIDSEAF